VYQEGIREAILDIWALGIIFARLIMGRYQWTVAITEDTGFKKYLDDDMSFRSYNFADKAHTLIRGMLQVYPEKRMDSVQKIIDTIDEIDYFSATPSDSSMSIDS